MTAVPEVLSLDEAQEERARKIHESAIVVDIGASTNPAEASPYVNGEYALERLRRGGVTALNATVAGTRDNFRQAINKIMEVRRFVKTRSDAAVLVQTAQDIQRAKAEGKVGVTVYFQQGSAFEDDWLNTIPALQVLGLRVTTLTYNERNLIGCGCYETTDDGLSAYGKQVVRGLNANGIIIDGSHVGQRTVRDAAACSAAPIIYSHTNAAALFPHPRNASDDNLKAVADTGGVIGTTAWEVLLKRSPDHLPTLSDLLDNIDYCASLVGIDHVGIGTDLNENFRAMPIQSVWEATYMGPSYRNRELPGFEWLSDFPNVTRGLVQRGYSDEDITKVLGGNFMRVAEQVWGQ
jgi:membrane dipeptidase